MAKLSSKKASSTSSVMLFGGPFTGKSKLAGELSEYFDLIWVDMENGHEVLFELPAEWQERIDIIDLPDTRSYPIAIETCLKMIKGAVSICEEHGKVGCMICKRAGGETIDVDLPHLGSDKIAVFDSLTQLTNSAIAHITKKEADDYKLNYDDWAHLGKLLDIFLSHLQQARYNVIVISHEAECETEGKKKKLVPVGGTRNFSRNIAKYFDHVVYAEVKNKKHIFGSGTTYAPNILTGSRTNVGLENMDKPSLLPIFKPELFPDSSTSKAIPKKGGGATATSILKDLKNRK